MSRKQNLYTGRSGQLAVLAEFLRRGYNAASPEIDVGEDVFVIRDEDGDLSRIQVKAAGGKGVRKVSGTFNVPMGQLRKLHEPELYYVFTAYHGGFWRDFVILSRGDLETLHDVQGVGTVAGNSLVIRLSYSPQDGRCKGTSLQQFRDNWSKWPPLQH